MKHGVCRLWLVSIVVLFGVSASWVTQARGWPNGIHAEVGAVSFEENVPVSQRAVNVERHYLVVRLLERTHLGIGDQAVEGVLGLDDLPSSQGDPTDLIRRLIQRA